MHMFADLILSSQYRLDETIIQYFMHLFFLPLFFSFLRLIVYEYCKCRLINNSNNKRWSSLYTKVLTVMYNIIIYSIYILSFNAPYAEHDRFVQAIHFPRAVARAEITAAFLLSRIQGLSYELRRLEIQGQWGQSGP
jgi:hypothetical protein